MRIEHLAIWTADIERLKQFYAAHFGAEAGTAYRNPVKGFESCFLTFAGGARLELMKSTALTWATSEPGSQRLGIAHFAISLGSEQRVNELTEHLRQAGFPVLDAPRRTGDGYYESVVLDPDGNRIELTA